jgi:hypothetical protein
LTKSNEIPKTGRPGSHSDIVQTLAGLGSYSENMSTLKLHCNKKSLEKKIRIY